MISWCSPYWRDSFEAHVSLRTIEQRREHRSFSPYEWTNRSFFSLAKERPILPPCEGGLGGGGGSFEIGNDFFRQRSASRPARMIRSTGWGSPAHRGSGSGRRPRTLSFRSVSFSSGNGETRSPSGRSSRTGCTHRARETPDHRAPRGPVGDRAGDVRGVGRAAATPKSVRRASSCFESQCMLAGLRSR